MELTAAVDIAAGFEVAIASVLSAPSLALVTSYLECPAVFIFGFATEISE